MISVKWYSCDEAVKLAGFLEVMTGSPPKNALCAVAFKEGELAGAGFLCMEFSHTNTQKAVKYVAVKEECRRQGIGSLILRMLIRRAYDMGCVESVVKAPVEVEGFFTSLGYAWQSADNGIVILRRDGDVFGNCSK